MPVMTKPGTVLMTSEPFAYAAFLNSSVAHGDGVDVEICCDTCLIQSGANGPQLLRCSACRMVWYCDTACQKKGWKDGHKYECPGMNQTREAVIEFESLPRLLLRTLVKLQDGKDHFEVVTTEQGEVKRRFMDLVSHAEDIKNDKKGLKKAMSIISTATQLLQLSPKKIAIPGESELLEIFGRITINLFSIASDIKPRGVGVYLAGSIFNHSCDEMATKDFEGISMVIRSIKEIPEGFPNDKVTIKYRSTRRSYDLVPSMGRNVQLKADYYFECQCDKCTKGLFDKELQSFICFKDGCNNKIGFLVLGNPCGSCGNKLPERELADLLNTTRIAMLETLKCEDPFFMVSRLEQNNFSEGHWLMIHFCKEAFRLSSINGNWDRAYHYGWKHLKAIRRYLDPNHPDIAWYSLKLALAALNLDKIAEGEQLFKEAKSILEIANLSNVNFYKEEIIQVEKMMELVKRRLFELYLSNSCKFLRTRM